MQFAKIIKLTALCFVLLGCTSDPPSNPKPPSAEMIFWELQSWEVGSGRSRLTIWSDGRSEVMVIPDAHFRRQPENLRPRDGWTMKEGREGVYFIRTNVFQEQVAKEKLNQALAAGIHLLNTFKPDYVDGSGTQVGVQIDGELKEIVIPMFLDRQRGSANHKRFVAVLKVLSDFDRHAYDILR